MTSWIGSAVRRLRRSPARGEHRTRDGHDRSEGGPGGPEAIAGGRRAPSRAAGSVTAQALEAARDLGAVHPAPILLGYHPVMPGNPYAALLYGRAWEAGIAPVPVSTRAQFAELARLAADGHRVVLHLHWLNRPLGRATTAAEAAASGRAFLQLLDSLHQAGGRIAWTVHNLLPHAARFEEEECRFRGAVAARADVIHVMASGTRSLVAPYFELPEDRILHVPHPNYIGMYPDTVGRGQARHDLRLGPKELVYLALGSIRSYKGIDALLDAWGDLPRGDGPRRLLIAGQPAREPGVAELLQRAGTLADVVVHAGRIDLDAMGTYLRAADVAVLPYRRSLNSGALMLAMSFDLPVIVPAGGGLAELVDGRNGIAYEAGDRGRLADALRRAPEIATPAGRAAAGETARRYDAAVLSDRFAAGLRERLGWN